MLSKKLENKVIKTIYIIGAGIAGLSCAVSLVSQGYRVVLFESASRAGGRCRSFHDKKLDVEIDNGNHLLIGANKDALSLINKIGSLDRFYSPQEAIFPFTCMRTGKKWEIKPQSLLKDILMGKSIVPDSPMGEKLKILKLLMVSKQSTISNSLGGENNILFERLWQPMSESILNTPVDEASAAMFLNILRKVSSCGKEGFRQYIPKKSWADALINPCIEFIEKNGGEIHFNNMVQEFSYSDNKISKLSISGNIIKIDDNDNVVLAVPHNIAGKLVDNISIPQETCPIVNVHFKHNIKNQPNYSYMGVTAGTSHWLHYHNNIISSTTSAAADLIPMKDDEIASLIWQEVRAAFNIDRKMPEYRVIKEKRATFSCSPDNLKKRPPAKTSYNNLFLAGDYVQNNLPATIDGAALSGEIAAKLSCKKG